MTKPFALDEDGGITVVGLPMLECFLEGDERRTDQQAARVTDQTDDR
ncbi:hypothetical protein [Halapricum salinum]|nr:hypothetical protein [Halapricum salinum]